MTTDSWERVKTAFAGLWRQYRPDQADTVEADLEAGRAATAAALPMGDEVTGAELAAEWRSRLRRLVEPSGEARAELQRLTEEFRPLIDAGPVSPVVITARASGSSRINQAGRDQTVIGG